MKRHVLLVLLRLLIAVGIVFALPLSHLQWGERYPGDGQQAFGFIAIFIAIGFVAAGFFLGLGSLGQFLLRRRPSFFTALTDLALCVGFSGVLIYGGITAKYKDSQTAKRDDQPAASVAPKLIGFSLHWVHPKLPASPQVRVDDAATAARLASVFEGYYLPLKGTPYDCPMYDVVITLHGADGTSTDLKVYLPRAKVFPGMWKHPDGVLNYFEVEKSEQKILVEILRPYIPKSPVYPMTMTTWPPVQFNKGIPDFRQIDYQISGDFSPSDFVHGGQ